jgi:hypothetical protein|tara:strand:- start:398 stop:511 length:114 start_codon:yes stop_codon:yes gene_type:complete
MIQQAAFLFIAGGLLLILVVAVMTIIEVNKVGDNDDL